MEKNKANGETTERPESLKTVLIFSMFGFLSYSLFGAVLGSAEEMLAGDAVSTSKKINNVIKIPYKLKITTKCV